MADPRATIIFDGDSGPLEKAVGVAQSKLKQFGTSLPTSGLSALNSTLGALGVTLSAGTFVAAMRSAIDSLDQLEESAQSAGVSIKSLQELRYAASFAGVGSEELESALTRLNVKLGDAAEGSLEAKASFQALGISTRNSSGQLIQTDEALKQIADRFAGYRDGAAKSALAVDIFGRAGAKLIPLLNLGADGLEKLKEEAHKLGIVIGDDGVKAASKFNDELDRLALSAKAAKESLAVEILPFMSKLVDEWEAARKATGSFSGALLLTNKYFALSREEAAESIKEVEHRISLYEKEIAAMEKFRGQEGSIKANKERIFNLQTELNFLKQIQAARALADTPNVVDTDYRVRGQTLKDAPVKPDLAAEAARLKAADEAKQKFIQNILDEAIAQKKLSDEEKVRVREFLQGLQEKAQAEFDIRQQRLQANLEASETERETEARQNQEAIARLRELLNEKFINEQEYAEKTAELELQRQARLGDIYAQGVLNRRKFDEMNAIQQADNVLGTLAFVTSGVADQSRKMFELHKAAAIGSAIVSSYQGAAKAYADYGWPWGVLIAAVTLAAGLANVEKIRSTRFGQMTAGGGGVGSASAVLPPAASDATPNQGVAAAPTRRVEVVLVGDGVFTAQNVRDQLIPLLNEAAGDGLEITVARG